MAFDTASVPPPPSLASPGTDLGGALIGDLERLGKHYQAADRRGAIKQARRQ